MVNQKTNLDTQIFFYGTQAQSNLDDWDSEDQRKQKLSTLSTRFSYKDENNSQSSLSQQQAKRKKQQQKITVPKKKRNTLKIKSLNDRMTKKYSSKSPLLIALSGKKHKINDLLKNIRSVEKEEIDSEKYPLSLSKDSELTGVSSISSLSNISSEESGEEDFNILYTRDEWHNVIGCINKNFPKLSKRTKRTLDYITEKYHQQESKEEDEEEPHLNDGRQNSLWDSASQSITLAKEEVELLYDFKNKDQSFYDNSESGSVSSNSDSSLDGEILTLSQVIRTSNKVKYTENVIDTLNEIEDSQEEIVPALTRSNFVEQAENSLEDSNKESVSASRFHSYNKETTPLVHNSHSNQNDLISLSSSFSIFPNINSGSQHIEHHSNIAIASLPGTQQDPISLSSDSTPFDLKLQKRILPEANPKSGEVQVLATVDQFSAQVTSFNADIRFLKNRMSPSRDKQVEVITSSPISSPISKPDKSPTRTLIGEDAQQFNFGSLKSSPLKDDTKLETINQLPMEFNGNNEEVIVSQSQFCSPVAKKLVLDIVDSQSEEEQEEQDNLFPSHEFRHVFGDQKTKPASSNKTNMPSQNNLFIEQNNDPIFKTVFGKKKHVPFEISDFNPELNKDENVDEDGYSFQKTFPKDTKDRLMRFSSDLDSSSESETDIFMSCKTQQPKLSQTQSLKLKNTQTKSFLDQIKATTDIPDSQVPAETSEDEGKTVKSILPAGFFEKYTYDQLKEQTDAWGLKRIKTKKAMISMLYLTTKLMPKESLYKGLESYNNGSTSILELVNNDKESGSSVHGKNPILDLKIVHKSLYAKIRELLIDNRQLHKKILIYQPLNLYEVYEFVKTRLQHDQLELKIVSNCLDELGICYTSSFGANVEEFRQQEEL